MSISSIQKQRAFESATKQYFSTGKKPRLVDIMKNVSEHFSIHPSGLPLIYDDTYLGQGLKSNVTKFNTRMQDTIENLDVLYEASFEQVDSVMTVSTILRTELERLDARRKKLTTRIDDFLFSLYNTDGYYFAISDNFSDLSLVDLNLTNAIIDPVAGNVTIGTAGDGVRPVDYQSVTSANMVCQTSDGLAISFNNVSSFANAMDGLTNTAWMIELDRNNPDAITCILTIGLSGSPVVSKIDFNPYGIMPVQIFVETQLGGGAFTQFGNSIKSSVDQINFVDQARPVDQIRFTITKHASDYTVDNNGQSLYKFVFGAKEIACSEYIYKTTATLVSQPLEIDRSLVGEFVIDAVTLTTNVDLPINTQLNFYVAPEVDNINPELSDFDWHAITPIDQLNEASNTIVYFDGAKNITKNIKANPGTGDLQLIGLDSVNADLQKRNPSPAIVDGADIYRIAQFLDTPLSKSFSLEEGINTTRILHTERSTDAINGLSFWAPFVNNTSDASFITTYGHIDGGTGFFYGGDVGQNSRSIYVETYLESLETQPIIIKSFRKSDSNSKQWAIRVYLNGREVAFLPVGTDEFLIPWVFQQGFNHICMIVDIPASTESFPSVYLGTISLMGDSNLNEFGTVKLADWTYVDFFNLQYNQVGQPNVFSVYNNEIVSRRIPTCNFRVKYSTSFATSPNAVRVRADLARDGANPNVTPILNSYRLRFKYNQG